MTSINLTAFKTASAQSRSQGSRVAEGLRPPPVGRRGDSAWREVLERRRRVLPVCLGSEVRDRVRNGATVVGGGEVGRRQRRGTTWAAQLQRWHFIPLQHTHACTHTPVYSPLTPQASSVECRRSFHQTILPSDVCLHASACERASPVGI